MECYNESAQQLNNAQSLLQNVDVVLADDEKYPTTRKEKKLYKKKWRYILDDDKRFRGPFSCFSLRILAWVCIVLSQAAVVLSLAADMTMDPLFSKLSSGISVFSSLSMPLFLLANFAYIIQNKNSILRVLLTYLFMMIVLAGMYYLIFLHYLVGMYAQIFQVSFEDAYATFNLLITTLFSGTFKFNIFVDLFICTLLVYFCLGTPKKIFTGKKIIIFRSLAILPLVYEFSTIILKVLSIDNLVTIPFLFIPFMPTKCPLTFLAFILIVAHEMKRKRKYIKYNGTDEQYEQYFYTNKNSWLFSKTTAKCFAVVGLLDVIVYVVLYAVSNGIPGIFDGDSIIKTLEIGESVGLLIISPFIFLFSYNRMFKPSKMDLFLPILAVIAIVIIWLEAAYQAAGMLMQ